MIKKILIPTFRDERGALSAIEIKDIADWEVKRVYYVTNVNSDRGGHAVIGEKKVYVCVSGSVRGKFFDGNHWTEFNLKGPSDAVLMDGMYWREFDNFSDGSVLMAISNMNYEPDKYIYDIEKFRSECLN